MITVGINFLLVTKVGRSYFGRIKTATRRGLGLRLIIALMSNAIIFLHNFFQPITV